MAHRLYWFVLVDSEGTILDKCDLDFMLEFSEYLVYIKHTD
jgi:hypothetical protein